MRFLQLLLSLLMFACSAVNPVKVTVTSDPEHQTVKFLDCPKSKYWSRPDSNTFWVISAGTWGIFSPDPSENMEISIRENSFEGDQQVFIMHPPVYQEKDLILGGPSGWLKPIKIGSKWHVFMVPPKQHYGRNEFTITVDKNVFKFTVLVRDSKGDVTLGPGPGNAIIRTAPF